MQARQGNHIPHNVYLEDDKWDHDILLFQAHTPRSAEFIVEALNFYIETQAVSENSIHIRRMLNALPSVGKRVK